ncbi:YraN family protein [Helicobacter sp. NHP21005]|uniref:YraN family protein n=1 Tax=Helicobacter felistomachi TaxID=3040201 RepID=UPI002572D798|nr:YraN family protein [Helicobacter sp. NHP21005]BEG56667.1 YraN family protein [Helicobacter sp. NHP21005]
MNTRGQLAEDLACVYLQKQGCKILCRNFYSSFGEIDIVATKDGVLHFVEVKCRRKDVPIYAITPKKLEKIQKTIAVYLQENPSDLPFCIDALTLQGELPNCHIEWLQNIGF